MSDVKKASDRPWFMEGPHTVKDTPDSLAFLIVNHKTVVAQIIHNPKEGDDTEVCRADASLIVEAVNSFEALKRVAEAAEAVNQWLYESASARATGESIYTATDFEKMREISTEALQQALTTLRASQPAEKK